MDWKKRLLQLFRIGVSVVLVVWLLRIADSAQLSTLLVGANVFLLLLMMLVANFDRVFMAYKWNLLLRAKNIVYPMIDAISVYYRSSFLGMLILPTVGADAMRIFEVSRKTGKTEEIVSSVVIERFIGLVSMGIVGVISLGLFIAQVDQNGWATMLSLLAGLAVLIGAFAVSMNTRLQQMIAPPMLRSRWKIVRKFGQIFQSYHQFGAHRTALLIFLAYSILEQFISVITAYLVSAALGLSIPFLYFLIFIPIITTIVRLPISFDGFGVREGLYVYLFGLVGVASTDAFLVGLLSSVLWRIGTALPALYFFWMRRESPLAARNAQQPATLTDEANSSVSAGNPL